MSVEKALHASPRVVELEKMSEALAEREARGGPVDPAWREIAHRLAEELRQTSLLAEALEL